jgi:xanthine/CO dehydrogenase XdhC/CoxF family maturation factor
LSSQNIVTQIVPKPLLTFYREHADAGEPLALITTLATDGSTYSKTGKQLLMSRDGRMSGLVSGGCLEGDLLLRAIDAIDTGCRALVTYDLSDDELFGLGVGCQGTMVISIEPLLASNGYEPFAGIENRLLETGSIDLEASLGDPGGRVHYRLLAPRRLGILGAGPDCSPLLAIAETLGWDVTVVDHRQQALDALDADNAICCASPADLEVTVDCGGLHAVVIMSHNLGRDRGYLGVLAPSSVPFVGLLGPAHRRDRLLTELGEAAQKLNGRLRAPVGRQIGGRGAEAIALEIATELQAFFHEGL